ncbi:ankyrin-1 [Elysia marginata]|uniref:Ankyrin-1 n=1 Tax=Elysia marginata TaxID=1093978 RepID=A0AAV4JBR8_9GAST|nr:ankyrin-1 [Elysia marginata]
MAEGNNFVTAMIVRIFSKRTGRDGESSERTGRDGEDSERTGRDGEDSERTGRDGEDSERTGRDDACGTTEEGDDFDTTKNCEVFKERKENRETSNSRAGREKMKENSPPNQKDKKKKKIGKNKQELNELTIPEMLRNRSSSTKRNAPSPPSGQDSQRARLDS